jgi:CBS domain-containing protein
LHLDDEGGRAVRVENLMSKGIRTCAPETRLNEAVRLMWEGDCGCIPVIASGRLVGIVTDRDACMAAYTRGRPLWDIAVRDAMATAVRTCGAADSLERAVETMREAKVRRLPVIDASGNVVGLLSLSDIARAISTQRLAKVRRELSDALAEALSAICEPRQLPAGEATA